MRTASSLRQARGHCGSTQFARGVKRPAFTRSPSYRVFADSHAALVQGNKMTGSYGSGSFANGGIEEWPVMNPLNFPPQR